MTLPSFWHADPERALDDYGQSPDVGRRLRLRSSIRDIEPDPELDAMLDQEERDVRAAHARRALKREREAKEQFARARDLLGAPPQFESATHRQLGIPKVAHDPAATARTAAALRELQSKVGLSPTERSRLEKLGTGFTAPVMTDEEFLASAGAGFTPEQAADAKARLELRERQRQARKALDADELARAYSRGPLTLRQRRDLEDFLLESLPPEERGREARRQGGVDWFRGLPVPPEMRDLGREERGGPASPRDVARYQRAMLRFALEKIDEAELEMEHGAQELYAPQVPTARQFAGMVVEGVGDIIGTPIVIATRIVAQGFGVLEENPELLFGLVPWVGGHVAKWLKWKRAAGLQRLGRRALGTMAVAAIVRNAVPEWQPEEARKIRAMLAAEDEMFAADPDSTPLDQPSHDAVQAVVGAVDFLLFTAGILEREAGDWTKLGQQWEAAVPRGNMMLPGAGAILEAIWDDPAGMVGGRPFTTLQLVHPAIRAMGKMAKAAAGRAGRASPALQAVIDVSRDKMRQTVDAYRRAVDAVARKMGRTLNQEAASQVLYETSAAAAAVQKEIVGPLVRASAAARAEALARQDVPILQGPEADLGRVRAFGHPGADITARPRPTPPERRPPDITEPDSPPAQMTGDITSPDLAPPAPVPRPAPPDPVTRPDQPLPIPLPEPPAPVPRPTSPLPKHPGPAPRAPHIAPMPGLDPVNLPVYRELPTPLGEAAPVVSFADTTPVIVDFPGRQSKVVDIPRQAFDAIARSEADYLAWVVKAVEANPEEATSVLQKVRQVMEAEVSGQVRGGTMFPRQRKKEARSDLEWAQHNRRLQAADSAIRRERAPGTHDVAIDAQGKVTVNTDGVPSVSLQGSVPHDVARKAWAERTLLQRQVTARRVTEAVVRKQGEAFLTEGTITPLSLKEVAAEVGISTRALRHAAYRLVKTKTPNESVFPLWEFFPEATPHSAPITRAKALMRRLYDASNLVASIGAAKRNLRNVANWLDARQKHADAMAARRQAAAKSKQAELQADRADAAARRAQDKAWARADDAAQRDWRKRMLKADRADDAAIARWAASLRKADLADAAAKARWEKDVARLRRATARRHERAIREANEAFKQERRAFEKDEALHRWTDKALESDRTFDTAWSTAIDAAGLLDPDFWNAKDKGSRRWNKELERRIDAAENEFGATVMDVATERARDYRRSAARQITRNFADAADAADPSAWTAAHQALIDDAKLVQVDGPTPTDMGKRARRLSPETMEFLGLPPGSAIYAHKGLANHLRRQAEAHNVMASDSLILRATRYWRKNLTVWYPKSGLNNMLSEQGLFFANHGWINPIESVHLGLEYAHWQAGKRRKGKDQLHRDFEALEATGILDSSVLEVELAAVAPVVSWGRNVQRSAQAAGVVGRVASRKGGLRGQLRRVNGLAEAGYRFGSNLAKVQEVFASARKLEERIGQLSTGNSITVPLPGHRTATITRTQDPGTPSYTITYSRQRLERTPHATVKVPKTAKTAEKQIGEGFEPRYVYTPETPASGAAAVRRAGDSEMRRVALHYGAKIAEDRYFNMSDTSKPGERIINRLRGSGFVHVSPFPTWFIKALDIPFYKKGLLARMIEDPAPMRSTCPEVNAAIGRELMETTVRRAMIQGQTHGDLDKLLLSREIHRIMAGSAGWSKGEVGTDVLALGALVQVMTDPTAEDIVKFRDVGTLNWLAPTLLWTRAGDWLWGSLARPSVSVEEAAKGYEMPDQLALLQQMITRPDRFSMRNLAQVFAMSGTVLSDLYGALESGQLDERTLVRVGLPAMISGMWQSVLKAPTAIPGATEWLTENGLGEVLPYTEAGRELRLPKEVRTGALGLLAREFLGMVHRKIVIMDREGGDRVGAYFRACNEMALNFEQGLRRNHADWATRNADLVDPTQIDDREREINAVVGEMQTILTAYEQSYRERLGEMLEQARERAEAPGED